jgi:hypothetical protein
MPVRAGDALIYVKVHKRGGHICAAACDEELLGKTLEDHPYCVEVKASFFKGELVEDDDNETVAVFRRASSLNLFGDRAVALGVAAGCIDSERVVRIKGVPHAQMFTI